MYSDACQGESEHAHKEMRTAMSLKKRVVTQKLWQCAHCTLLMEISCDASPRRQDTSDCRLSPSLNRILPSKPLGRDVKT